MRKFSRVGRLSALLTMSVVVGVLIVPTLASAAITCYGGTTRDLYVGVSDGEDIRNLQKVFNNDPDTQVWNIPGQSGYPGSETSKFGPRTEDAVKKFQVKYNIVTSGTPDTTGYGRVGSRTRAQLTELYGCGGGMTAYDYTDDGVTDKLDEFFLRDLILENKACPAETVCDVNNDKQIDVADVLALVAYLDANRPTITVTTPTASVQSGSAYTIRWTTAPRPIKSGVNIRILKNGAVILGQQFGRPSGNISYDYNNNGVVDKNDSYVLIDVALDPENHSCPVGKVCDLDGNGGVFGNDVIILVNLILNNTALPDTGSFVWNVPAHLTLGGGYQIQVVAENDASVVGMSGFFSITAPPTGTLTVTKNGNGTVNSTFPVGDIDCGATSTTCAHTYTTGTTLTLEATPDLGHRFVSWIGCVPLGFPAQCAVTVSSGSSRNVTATFELIPPVSAAFSVSQVVPIPYNTNATLVWFSTNATSCTASGGVGAWAGAKSTSGNQSIGPLTADTTFALSCTGAAGTDTKSITVMVAPPPVVAVSFRAVPSSVSYGNTATLSWSAPNAASCTASGGWSGTKAKTGTESTGPLTDDRTYGLSCSGLGSADPAYDLTNDGRVDAADATFLENVLLLTTSCAVSKCDLDRDGSINGGDLTKLIDVISRSIAEASTAVRVVPTIKITAPSAGVQLEQGKSYPITWTTEGSVGNNFDVIVLRNGTPVTSQRFTTTSATSPRAFIWNIPTTLTAGGGYAIRVEAISNRAVQGTSGTFSIVPQPKIQVTSPNSGTEAWNIGSITNPKNITWTSMGLVGTSVNIVLKRHLGVGLPSEVVGLLTPTGTANNQGNSITPQSNTFPWRLAENWLAAGGGYVIQICSISIPTLCDESDKPFTIQDEIPKVVFTADPTLTPASPYTVGESVVSYKASLQNNGIRQLSGLTLAAHIKQGGAGATVEFSLACRTQLPGIMAPGSCFSDNASQLLPIREGVGKFTQGQGNIVLEVKQGATVLATKSVTVQLYPAPSVQVLSPNGPASVNRFELGKSLPQPIRWKTQGLIDNVVIKIKQADPVPLYDFNNDSAVNQQDADVLTSFFARSSDNAECFAATGKNCDIDGDGELFGNDIVWLIGNILLADPLRYVDRVEMFDFSGDQAFNVFDTSALSQAIAGSGSLAGCFAQTGNNCDVNRDGTHNVHDGNYLINILNAPPPVTTLPGASILTNNKDKETIFPWTPEAPFVLPAGNYKIVVCDLSRPKVCDESDHTFLIYAGPPTITSPTGPPPSNVPIRKFFIQEDMNIAVNAWHTLPLTNYKIGLYQNNQFIYENVRDGGSTTIVPFSINNLLVRSSDGKRVIDVLREGQLRIAVSGALGGGRGFTNSAERIVQLEFNRKPPIFQEPTPAEGQEVNLGKVPIKIAATHDAKPKRYVLTLSQNLETVFQQTIDAQPDGSFVFEFTRTTLQQPSSPLSATNRKVFDTLENGPVLITLRGILRDGAASDPAVLTDVAERRITVIPVPPNFDLNGDGDIDIEDFKILQLTVLGERKCTDSPVTADKDCDLNRDGKVDVADLASMVSHPLYQKPQEPPPSLPAIGAPVKVPTITSPQSGAAWSTGTQIVIQEVAGATGYLVGFIRDRQLIYENYRDEGKTTKSLAIPAGVSGTRVYQVPAAAVSKFSAGPMTIVVRALVNNQWTDAAVIPVAVSGSGAVAPPPVTPPSSTGTPPPATQASPATDSTKVNVVSPKTGDIWVRANPQSIIFQPFPASTAYYFRFSGAQGGIRSKVIFANTSVSATGPELQKISNISLATTVDLRSYFIPRDTLNKLELGYVFLDVGAFVNGQWTLPTTIAITVR